MKIFGHIERVYFIQIQEGQQRRHAVQDVTAKGDGIGCFQ